MEIDPRFAATEYVVEADSFGKYALWVMNSKDNVWEQDASGVWFQIGELGGTLQKKRPVCIECFWARINGMTVMFYHSSSQVVDHEMIEKWLEKNCYPYNANSKRRAHCDALNFHHCIQYSKEKRPPVEIQGLITLPFRFYAPSKSL